MTMTLQQKIESYVEKKYSGESTETKEEIKERLKDIEHVEIYVLTDPEFDKGYYIHDKRINQWYFKYYDLALIQKCKENRPLKTYKPLNKFGEKYLILLYDYDNGRGASVIDDTWEIMV